MKDSDGITPCETVLPSPPSPHRRSDHLPRLAEAMAGPEDVVLVLVTAPVLVGSGASASAVLREGCGGIDVTGEEQEGGLENSRATLPRIILEETSTFIIEGLDHFPGDGYGISFPIDIDAETVREISSFVRKDECNLFFGSHLCKPVLRTHLLPSLLDPGGRHFATDNG